MSGPKIVDASVPFDPDKDNEAIADGEILPLMQKVFEICAAHGIPFIAAFQYRREHLATYGDVPDRDDCPVLSQMIAVLMEGAQFISRRKVPS